MTAKKKNIPFAIASMISGAAAMPVAGIINTALGIFLAVLAVTLIYMAG